MKKFEVPNIYRSALISNIKSSRSRLDKMKKDFSPTLLELGSLKIYLARHFGFCYGVENAIDIAFRTIRENKGKRIFLLSEMIHNPQVNADLEAEGVQFLQDTYGNQLIDFDNLKKDDVVLIPAFGTTLEIEEKLASIGIQTEKFNTTCPFVEKVWNRSGQIAEKGYSIIVHGKPKHEETRATFSHASDKTPTLILNNFKDAQDLAKFITGESPANEFYERFRNCYSEGFDVNNDLKKIGVVNQTTQLASDTLEIVNFLRSVYKSHYQLDDSNIQTRFADTRDTLCYATNDNQSAVQGLMEESKDADFALVVGGYKSSNTSHLVEICEKSLPTYFINSADKLLSKQSIVSCNWKTKEEFTTENYIDLHKETIKVLITSGASCPDAIVEEVVYKLASFFNVEPLLENLETTFLNN
ncbi:4-hydroxy-3-methylbut-2-enyl diphosphate reductase [Rhizosphaericola mali]|uniref:4-hydroxy-3-methylbut-2-enyl diphosphate reductase n=1 Tax=Rhizosphaericola mali TaxID=2545455 RepID=A0A5P2G8N9_9BACT|nr:4-hydroxy-3-methylbut-2-enyl diphosphate reductase [Rhizosphaericola mali]QES87891.1 4-hydroxy-3-methylbut-2-enyl diphosphate reductase [Rhizosphaericola mali]